MDKRDSSGVRFPPPLIYILLLTLGFLIQRVWPIGLVPIRNFPIGNVAVGALVIVRTAGALLLIGALLLCGAAIGSFRFARTSVIPMRPTTALVFVGPYRFTRNPMYLGFLVASAGIALMSNALWPLLMTPIMLMIVRQSVIAREERYLTAKFGEPYTAYKSRVRRWI